jgi:hypothetical protein
MEAGKTTALMRLKSSYVTIAVIFLNSSLLFLFLVGACYVYLWIRPPYKREPSSYSKAARTRAIHTLSPSAARECFSSFQKLDLDMAYVYRPWVEFSDRPYRSACLNVDDADPLPLRRTVPASREVAAKTIWLFGGSTQFGVGVPDNQTIASHLSAILSKTGTPYKVVNHGHTWYYSTQEAALFANLLRHGQRSEIAVFLDGLNDSLSSVDLPTFSSEVASGFLKEERAASGMTTTHLVVSPAFPPAIVLNRLLGRLFGRQPPTNNADAGGPVVAYDPVDIYRFNLTAIEKMAEAANVKLAVYWQPTPFDYIAGSEQRRKGRNWKEIPRVNALIRQRIPDSSFHFIADLFKTYSYEDIYVDRVHYGDEGCRLIAEAIAANLKSTGLVSGD